MRMIAGLEDLSEGVIKIGSKIVNDLEPKDRDVSMVFQSYGLYPNMTVYENVRFPLKIRKVPKENHDDLVMRAERCSIFGSRWSRRALKCVRFSFNLVSKFELDF